MWERPLSRPWETPDYPGPQHFQSYRIVAPLSSHRRRATCAEVECEKRKRGFRAQFDVSTIAGRNNAHRVEALKGSRMFSRHVEGPLVTYTFPAGQNCLDVHTVPLEREPFYVVQGGDHRGNPRGIAPQRLSEANFIDHFRNNQAQVQQRIERG